jgi:hypothetical protein
MALVQLDNTNEVIQAEAVPATQQDGELTTGLNQLAALDAAIFPNPVKGLVTIQLANAGQVNLVILSADGKTVANTRFSQQTTIDLTGIPAGLYAAVLTTPTGRATKRIIVQ